MPGGACRDLMRRSLREIADRWPSVNAEAINSAAKNYQVRLSHKAETPKDIRATMDEIALASSGLRVKLLTLSEEADNHLWNDFKETRQETTYQALPNLLRRLQQAAMRGHNAEVGKDGRKRLGPRHQLIAAIAWQLQEVGLEVDKRPTGDLRRLVEIVVQDLGEASPDTATIRDALNRMNGGD